MLGFSKFTTLAYDWPTSSKIRFTSLRLVVLITWNSIKLFNYSGSKCSWLMVSAGNLVPQSNASHCVLQITLCCHHNVFTGGAVKLPVIVQVICYISELAIRRTNERRPRRVARVAVGRYYCEMWNACNSHESGVMTISRSVWKAVSVRHWIARPTGQKC